MRYQSLISADVERESGLTVSAGPLIRTPREARERPRLRLGSPVGSLPVFRTVERLLIRVSRRRNATNSEGG